MEVGRWVSQFGNKRKILRKMNVSIDHGSSCLLRKKTIKNLLLHNLA